VRIRTKTAFPDKVCLSMFASWYFILILNKQLGVNPSSAAQTENYTDNTVHGNGVGMWFVAACAFDLIHLYISSLKKSKLVVVN
jgi:hypothetical protein